MKKYYFLIGVLLSGLLQSPMMAETPPARLRPVDSNNKSKCIEYFIINGKGYCRDTPSRQATISPENASYERIRFQFDKRDWKLGYWNHRPQNPAFEYTLATETVNSWTELLSTHFIQNAQKRLTPEGLMKAQLAELHKVGFHPKVTVHSQSSTDILYEWALDNTPAENQDVLLRIFATDQGIHIISYASRPKMTEAHRKDWQQLLMSAQAK